MSIIGQSVRRLEDRPLLTGAGQFAADIKFPGMVHMRVVRSPIAFGRLKGVDLSRARAHPAMVALWTAADVPGIPPIGFRLTAVPGLEPYRQPVLAQDRVRYVGEPIALVFASDIYLAEDIADLVVPDIEALQPCLDPVAAPRHQASSRPVSTRRPR
jgi:aerobic carbon-monoxide dehydrogenase large subunit